MVVLTLFLIWIRWSKFSDQIIKTECTFQATSPDTEINPKNHSPKFIFWLSFHSKKEKTMHIFIYWQNNYPKSHHFPGLLHGCKILYPRIEQNSSPRTYISIRKTHRTDTYSQAAITSLFRWLARKKLFRLHFEI